MDTIFALTSARGRAGVAVIRISGPRAASVLFDLSGALPKARQSSLRKLKASDGRVLDEALVLRFEAGASFTGQDVVELHLHGGVAVVNAVLDQLAVFESCRLAEPGEFTRLAMENGRLDLAEVEGLADLIDAQTEGQRRQAMQAFEGSAQDIISKWRETLVAALALIEVTIDFADEEVPVDVRPEVEAGLSEVLADVRDKIENTQRAERVREGFEVAILGAPNVGKSTLLNALAGRAAAITSEVAGTTRDVIEVQMDLQGIPVTFLDTAGLRETQDSVEKEGIARARERAQAADLRIFLKEGTVNVGSDLRHPDDIVVGAKGDINGSGVSGLTGLGIDQLVRDVTASLEKRVPHDVGFTRRRHRQALTRADVSLTKAFGSLDLAEEQPELISEQIWEAVRALESILGKVDIEAVLDDIFSRFCLGK